jgi:hypothetical protein
MNRSRPHARSQILAAILCLVLFTACTAPLSTLPRTDVPVFLPAFGPTLTPTMTPTPKPADYIRLGELVTHNLAGFSFTPVTTWDASGQPLLLVVESEHTRLSNDAETLFFNLSAEAAGSAQTAQTCLDRIVTRMRQDVTDLTVSAGQPRALAGLEGLVTQLTGNLLNQKILGLLSVGFTQQRCFSLLSLATGSEADTLWSGSGQAIDESLVSSLAWLAPSTQTTPVTCSLSSNPTYGTNPNNPIRIGNLAIYDGLQREELYLSTLRGPTNEEIVFSRLAPRFNAANEIVDVYEIRFNDSMKPIKLYFDTAKYEQPLAITGYTCEAAFPIQAP